MRNSRRARVILLCGGIALLAPALVGCLDQGVYPTVQLIDKSDKVVEDFNSRIQDGVDDVSRLTSGEQQP